MTCRICQVSIRYPGSEILARVRGQRSGHWWIRARSVAGTLCRASQTLAAAGDFVSDARRRTLSAGRWCWYVRWGGKGFVVSAEQQYAEVTTGALGALERSAELWKQGATRVTEQVGVVAKLPTPDLDEATDRYFDYLQRGIEVNRDLAKKWSGAISTLVDLARAQTSSAGEAVRGHAESVTDWISGAVDTAQKSAQEQADAIATARREQAHARYAGLSKTELTELLAQRDLPRTGTSDELIDRLVAADAQ